LLARGAVTAAVIAAAAGIVKIADANGAGLPAVGQVIPAAQRPMAPEISGTVAFWPAARVSVRGRSGDPARPVRQDSPATGTGTTARSGKDLEFSRTDGGGLYSGRS
jgi:hypothetical protein